MKDYTCLFCEDIYTDQDLASLKEIGEKYHLEAELFVCPDCYDDLRRLPLEEQLKALLLGSEYEWEEE
ncbi:hypothetical protein ACU70A_06490 [Syntrophomonas erecta subsp. sporosyntropha]